MSPEAQAALVEVHEARAAFEDRKKKAAEKGDAMSDAALGHAEAWLVRAMNAAREAGVPNAMLYPQRPETLTAIVRARMVALGLTQATLARRMAPRWGCSPDSAVATLSRWFNREPGGKGDMTTDKLAELLAELGLVVVPAHS